MHRDSDIQPVPLHRERDAWGWELHHAPRASGATGVGVLDAPERPPRPTLHLAPGGRSLIAPGLEAAVVLPPLVVYVASIVAGALAAKVQQPGVHAAPFKQALLLALLLPLLSAVVTTIRGLGQPRLSDVLLVPLALGLAATIDALLVGPSLGICTLSTATLLGAAAQPLARAWRGAMQRFRDVDATLVLSTPMGADEVIERLERIPGLRISSLLIPGAFERPGARLLGRPVYSRVVASLNRSRRAIVSSPRRDAGVNGVVAQLVARGFDVRSESAVLREAEGRVDSELASPLGLLMDRSGGPCCEAVYRLRDVLVAAVGLVAFLPVGLVIAALIRLDSKGPVFFRQRRLGVGGRPFKVIKFRTMRRDAEARTGAVWAKDDDPRVTRVGRFLRRTRLDEVPQLINVLLGQMSLVGPRPERAHFFRILREDIPMFELRTALRPGITGWAQVRASYASGTEEARIKLDHDLYYIARRSFWFDLAILFETFHVALTGKGAR